MPHCIVPLPRIWNWAILTLTATRGEAYRGARPALLQAQSSAPWRHNGSTAERIAHLALAMISGEETSCGPATEEILTNALPAIETAIGQCAPSETHSLYVLWMVVILRQAHQVPPREVGLKFCQQDAIFILLIHAPAYTNSLKVGQASSEALLQRHVMEEGNGHAL